MGVISRGIKNAFRNSIRTVSITFILGLSIAMALIMLLALKTVQAKIASVKSSIGNTISVSPAGVRGFEGGGELLTTQNANDVTAIANVTKVTQTVSDRLELIGSTSNRPAAAATSSSQTSLISPVQPGSFGNRQRQRQGASTSNNSAQQSTFTMPITVTGTNDLDSLSSLNLSKMDITAGEKFKPDTIDNVAMIGIDLATKNNLAVGQSFKAYNQDIKVAGIFDGGNTFSNAALLMPIKTVQALSGQTDQINSMIVQVSSIDSISSVSDAIKAKLGADKIDITSSQNSAQNAIAPLENIQTISLYSLIGALTAGAIIIFLTMLMIVRERRREIGVLKAIGSSNVKIVSQFTVESLVLTLTGSVLGIILGFIFSNPVLKVLITNSQTSTTGDNVAQQFARGGGMMARIGGGVGTAQSTLNNLHAVVGYQIILYGLLAAIAIAIIGSAIPAFFIAKIRPAEVMRAD